MIRKPHFFYGWIVVAIALVNFILIYGIRHSFTIFFPSILAEFDWERGSTAFMLSLNLLIYGLLAPVAGSLADRWKPRRVMLIGIGILSLATGSCAFANQLWHFYLLFGILVPVGMALSGWPLFTGALSNWFAKKRGLVMGLGQVGGGLSFAYGMFTEFVISQVRWRYAYFVLAGVVVAVTLPLYLIFYQYRPEDKGLKAYGAEELITTQDPTDELNVAQHSFHRDWTLLKAMRTYQLWLFVLSHSLYWGIGNYLVLAHQVKFTEDMGYTSMFGASVFALFGIFMVIGQLSGFIADSIGREKTYTLTTVFSISALVALILVKDVSQPWLLYIYTICFGYGAGLQTAASFAGMADIFHGKHFGAICGLLLTGQGIGGAIGPWLGGYIHDVSGSYVSAFVLCMVCFGIACAAFWIVAPRNASKLRVRILGSND